MAHLSTGGGHGRDGDLLEALGRSAEALDADPRSRLGAEGRARIWSELSAEIAGARSPWRRALDHLAAAVEPARLRRRVGATAMALSAFALVAGSAFAGPDVVTAHVGSAVSAVGQQLGVTGHASKAQHARDADDPEDTDEAATPEAEATPAATPEASHEHPANHGADVSAVARAKALESESGDEGATPEAHPANHGADVSAVAKSTPTGDVSHGEQVREVARDNHGQEVSATARDNHGQSLSQQAGKPSSVPPAPSQSAPGKSGGARPATGTGQSHGHSQGKGHGR